MTKMLRVMTIFGVVLGLVLSGSVFAQAALPKPDREVVNAVQGSMEFARIKVANPDLIVSQSMVRTARAGNYAVAVQALRSKDSLTTLSVAHFIEMTTGTVIAEKQVRLSVQKDTTAALAKYVADVDADGAGKVARIAVLENGKTEFVGTVTGSGILRGDPEYTALAEKAKANSATCEGCGDKTQHQSMDMPVLVGGVAQTYGWCRTMMDALCAVSGAGLCFFTCAGFGTTPAGLGCAALCAMIGFMGCVNTTNLVCGR